MAIILCPLGLRLENGFVRPQMGVIGALNRPYSGFVPGRFVDSTQLIGFVPGKSIFARFPVKYLTSI